MEALAMVLHAHLVPLCVKRAREEQVMTALSVAQDVLASTAAVFKRTPMVFVKEVVLLRTTTRGNAKVRINDFYMFDPLFILFQLALQNVPHVEYLDSMSPRPSTRLSALVAFLVLFCPKANVLIAARLAPS